MKTLGIAFVFLLVIVFCVASALLFNAGCGMLGSVC